MKKLLFLLLFSFFSAFVTANPKTDPQPETSCFSFPTVTDGSSVIKKGDVSFDVLKIQICMYEKGFNLTPLRNGRRNCDKIFGKITEKAIMSVQAAYKLPETGIVDATTAKVLEELCCGIDMQKAGRKYNISQEQIKLLTESQVALQRLDAIESRLDIVDAQNRKIDSLETLVDSFRNDQMFKKILIDNRKDRDLIEALVNNVAKMARQIDDLTTLVKNTHPTSDTVFDIANNIDSLDRSTSTGLSAEINNFAEWRAPANKGKLYQQNQNLVFEVVAKPLESKKGAGFAKVILGTYFAGEHLTLTDKNNFAVIGGYRSTLNPRKNSFDMGAGFYSVKQSHGALFYGAYHGKPFSQKSNSIQVNSDVTIRLNMNEGWLQLLKFDIVKPFANENFSIGLTGMTYRGHGHMTGDFLSTFCNGIGAIVKFHPSTTNISTWKPAAYISVMTDPSKQERYFNYNIVQAGLQFSFQKNNSRKMYQKNQNLNYTF